MLTALLSFQDDDSPPQNNNSHAHPPPTPAKGPRTSDENSPAPAPAPAPEVKVPEKTADDEVAILQAAEAVSTVELRDSITYSRQKEANEVVVGEVGDASKYAELCLNLLKVSFHLR